MNRDFEPEIQELADIMRDFMNTQIIPAEQVWAEQRDELGLDAPLPIVEELRRKSSRRGLWNLLQPHAAGISHLESARIARIIGWSPLLAPESINSQDPDYGNMNVLDTYANEKQRDNWLEPLFDGELRSAWAMTEPEELRQGRPRGRVTVEHRDGQFTLNGHLNFVAGVSDERCAFIILLAHSDSTDDGNEQCSALIVPTDTPGITRQPIRADIGPLPQLRMSQLAFDEVQIPAELMIGALGDGAKILAARLRLGRINRAMRSLGMADRALSNVAHQEEPDESARSWLRQSNLVIDAVQERILELAERLDDPDSELPTSAEFSTAADDAHRLALCISREANNYLQGHKGEDAGLISYFEGWISGMRTFDAADAISVNSLLLDAETMA